MSNDLPELPEIPEEAFITDPGQFEALTSGLRMRILELCHDPLSVREIAERLEMPITRLYYHVNLLDEAGFLDVVHTRKSGARLEKIYRVAGHRITPSPHLLENIDDTAAAAKAMAAIAIEPARAETEDALRRRFDGHEQTMHFGRLVEELTPDQLDEFIARITELVEDFVGPRTTTDPDGVAYSFTFALVPASRP